MALVLGKVSILVGAGILGSVLAKEGRVSGVSDFFSGAFKIVFKQIQRDDPRPSSGKTHNDSLMAQVNNLRMELQMLASNRPVTIIAGSNAGARSYGVPVVVIIVVGYGYIWWKGWKLSDMMFVTKRGLKDACSSVAKQLDHVSTSVTDAKRLLSLKIDRVGCSIDECADLTSATRHEVSKLGEDVMTFKDDVKFVADAVMTLEEKIGRIEVKQGETNSGVLALCNYAEYLENSRTAASIQASPSVRVLEPATITRSRTVSLPVLPPQEPPSPSSSTESLKLRRQLQSTVSASGIMDILGVSDTTNGITNSDVPNGASLSEDLSNPGSSGSSLFGRIVSRISFQQPRN